MLNASSNRMRRSAQVSQTDSGNYSKYVFHVHIYIKPYRCSEVFFLGGGGYELNEFQLAFIINTLK